MKPIAPAQMAASRPVSPSTSFLNARQIGKIGSGMRISEINGSHHVSPFVGKHVEDVIGVVTAVGKNGFYIQDYFPAALTSLDSEYDGMSQGIFVFLGVNSGARTKVGQVLRLNGKVDEYQAQRRPPASWLTTTQIIQVSIDEIIAESVELPAALALGKTGLHVPTEGFADPTINGSVDDPLAPFDRTKYHIDFWESLAGMRVQVSDAVVVGPTSKFGDYVVLADNGEGVKQFFPDGSLRISKDHQNPERIFIDQSMLPPNQRVHPNSGDKVTNLVGIVDYRFGNYRIILTEPPVLTSVPRERPFTTLVGDEDHLTIASYNVENMYAGKPHIAQLARDIVENGKSPDVLMLQEIQDNNGPKEGGGSKADQTLKEIVAAIKKIGGPVYAFRAIAPEYNKDGGQPHGNIQNVYLFREDRVKFVDSGRAGPLDETKIVKGSDGKPNLNLSPGRIDPKNGAYAGSRKVLAGAIEFNGKRIFLANLHFTSKGSDDPLVGLFQPPRRKSERRRVTQGEPVRHFFSELLQMDSAALYLAAGDYNDFGFSETIETMLEGAALLHIPVLQEDGSTEDDVLLPGGEESFSTYIHKGNSQVLDHMLGSPELARNAVLQALAINSPFAYGAGTSDHDMLIARIHIPRVRK